MIDYIRGEVAELTPTNVVIDCNGVGYDLNITVLDYSALQNVSASKLYVHESIREDAHVLYGFLEKRSRELFRLLIGVSGVGPNTARLILSSLTAAMLESTIASGDDKALKAVKGIGGKTAQRIIVDLKDKIKVSESTLILNEASLSESFEDAAAALVMLGFNNQQARKVLGKLFSENPSLTTESAIKQALPMM